MEDPNYDLEKSKNKLKNMGDLNLPRLNNDTVREIFDFDQTALQANRQGMVTRQQKDKILTVLKGEADSMWLLITILLGVSVLLAIIFSMEGLPTLPLVIGSGLITGGAMLTAYLRQNKLRDDTDRLRTFRVEGMPMIRGDYVGDSNAKLYISDQQLPITQPQAEALREFALSPMRIYYAANSKQVLSAEVLNDAEIEKLKVEDMDDEEYEIFTQRQLEAEAQEENYRQNSR